MGEFWSVMQWPTLAALVMSPIHCLFGLHIVRRGVIFIDLAVAQMAALGMAIAVANHHDVTSAAAYWLSLAFGLGTAFAISLTRFKLGRVPHEAIIGIIFVVETGSVILQVASMKLTGKRIFLFTPIHHHFERLGWAETQITFRFWVIGAIGGILGIVVFLATRSVGA